MKNKEIMNKKQLTIHIIITLLFVSSSIGIGMYIDDKGGDTLDFCKEHYRNETFLSDFIGDEPAELKVCASDQWRTGTIIRKCNDTCFDNVRKCLKEKATEEQTTFSRNCQWMGPDYFIMVGKLTFFFFIPISLLGINIAMLYEWNKKRRTKKK